MAKKRRSYRRRARRYYKKMGSPKIPIEVAAGLLSVPFLKSASFFSPYDYAKSGDTHNMIRSLVFGFTGVDTDGAVKPSISQIINPLDFSAAAMTKVLVVTGLASRIRKRFVKIPMKRIPFIGGIVS